MNNGGYMAVRRGLGQFGNEAVRTGRYPGAFLAQPGVVAVGGSWVAPRAAIAAEDWATITANARAAHQLAGATRAARMP